MAEIGIYLLVILVSHLTLAQLDDLETTTVFKSLSQSYSSSEVSTTPSSVLTTNPATVTRKTGNNGAALETLLDSNKTVTMVTNKPDVITQTSENTEPVTTTNQNIQTETIESEATSPSTLTSTTAQADVQTKSLILRITTESPETKSTEVTLLITTESLEMREDRELLYITIAICSGTVVLVFSIAVITYFTHRELPARVDIRKYASYTNV